MKSKKIVYLVSSLTLVAVTGAFIYNSVPKTKYEQNVNKIIQISEEERQEQLNKVVEDGMMNVNYTPYIAVNGNVSENFNIKNIENNKNPIKFKIIDDNDEVIYQSDVIELGYELNGLEFDKTFEKGTYEYRICIGYDAEGNVQSTFPITITSE